jgi:hypothetical protein
MDNVNMLPELPKNSKCALNDIKKKLILKWSNIQIIKKNISIFVSLTFFTRYKRRSDNFSHLIKVRPTLSLHNLGVFTHQPMNLG